MRTNKKAALHRHAFGEVLTVCASRVLFVGLVLSLSGGALAQISPTTVTTDDQPFFSGASRRFRPTQCGGLRPREVWSTPKAVCSLGPIC